MKTRSADKLNQYAVITRNRKVQDENKQVEFKVPRPVRKRNQPRAHPNGIKKVNKPESPSSNPEKKESAVQQNISEEVKVEEDRVLKDITNQNIPQPIPQPPQQQRVMLRNYVNQSLTWLHQQYCKEVEVFLLLSNLLKHIYLDSPEQYHLDKWYAVAKDQLSVKVDKHLARVRQFNEEFLVTIKAHSGRAREKNVQKLTSELETELMSSLDQDHIASIKKMIYNPDCLHLESERVFILEQLGMGLIDELETLYAKFKRMEKEKKTMQSQFMLDTIAYMWPTMTDEQKRQFTVKLGRMIFPSIGVPVDFAQVSLTRQKEFVMMLCQAIDK